MADAWTCNLRIRAARRKKKEPSCTEHLFPGARERQDVPMCPDARNVTKNVRAGPDEKRLHARAVLQADPTMSDAAFDSTHDDFRLTNPGPVPPVRAASAHAEYYVQQQDAVAFLRSLASASVDLLVTDPAYESLEKHRAVGTTTRLKRSKASSNEWFAIFPNARFPELFAEAYRVLRKHTHFYLFCDQETMFVAKPAAEAAGFRFWKPLVWDKRKIGMGYHYRSRYELILFFEKGKRRLADLSIPDVLEVPRIRGGYPAEKPPELSEILIRQSSTEGDVVVDPFLGSGSIGVAATRLERHFLGSDINADALRICNQRLSDAGARSSQSLYDALRA
jgi:site-specific DNA-methyltransferase (adenine-specific)